MVIVQPWIEIAYIDIYVIRLCLFDFKVARDSYKTHKGTESAELGKKFLEEWQVNPLIILLMLLLHVLLSL